MVNLAERILDSEQYLDSLYQWSRTNWLWKDIDHIAGQLRWDIPCVLTRDHQHWQIRATQLQLTS